MTNIQTVLEDRLLKALNKPLQMIKMKSVKQISKFKKKRRKKEKEKRIPGPGEMDSP